MESKSRRWDGEIGEHGYVDEVGEDEYINDEGDDNDNDDDGENFEEEEDEDDKDEEEIDEDKKVENDDDEGIDQRLGLSYFGFLVSVIGGKALEVGVLILFLVLFLEGGAEPISWERKENIDLEPIFWVESSEGVVGSLSPNNS